MWKADGHSHLLLCIAVFQEPPSAFQKKKLGLHFHIQASH